VDALDHPDSLRGGRADLRLIGDLLATFSCPWFVLPGNHDHPGLFAEVFGGRPQDTQVAGLRVLAFHDWEGEHHVPQRVGVERRRFDDALDDGDGRRQIHLQHYLIAPDRNEGYPHTYGEGEALRRRIVADGRVAAVLSGHYHAGVDPFRDGDTWFVTAPAFCEAPHPFWLHELDGEGDMHSERVDLR
jgi:hypothetical protein